eukprot:1162016-Pelagomonas_calceolata.AAC.5
MTRGWLHTIKAVSSKAGRHACVSDSRLMGTHGGEKRMEHKLAQGHLLMAVAEVQVLASSDLSDIPSRSPAIRNGGAGAWTPVPAPVPLLASWPAVPAPQRWHAPAYQHRQ